MGSPVGVDQWDSLARYASTGSTTTPAIAVRTLFLIGTASGDWSNDFSAQTLPDAAHDVIPGATRISTAFPESPRPDFKRHLDSFVAAVVEHLE